MIEYIDGDLIKLAKEGKFDVIVHGCNCFCTMSAGIAVEMAREFSCDNHQFYKLESPETKGDINKLGQIESYWTYVYKDDISTPENESKLIAVNAYTQYHYGKQFGIPFDYDAFILCMKKLNHVFKYKIIGMPLIGAGLAGGDWNKIESLINKYITNCKVIIVKYKPCH